MHTALGDKSSMFTVGVVLHNACTFSAIPFINFYRENLRVVFPRDEITLSRNHDPVSQDNPHTLL